MKKGGKAALLLVIAGVLMLAVALMALGLMQEQVSIGIIGGADGPTSVLVAGPDDGSLWLVGIGAVLAALGVGGWLWMRRHRE